MATVPALMAVNHTAVDARPLIKVGLLDFVEPPTPDDDGSYAIYKNLFDWLGDERVYSDIVRSLGHQADLAASFLAVDLKEDPTLVREAFDAAIRAWHVALWRLADEEIVLAENHAASTVLAPGRPSTQPNALS